MPKQLHTTTKMLLVHVVLALLVAGPANAADWRNGHRAVVTLTFDLDADTLWWDDVDSMTGNPSSLSQGRYGPLVAVPKILALLDGHGLQATFFIPSWVAETYPVVVRNIAEAGHEIGAHGVKHVPPVQLDPQEEEAVLDESLEVLTQIGGRKPSGYRAPAWAFSEHTLGLATAAGFSYSSNLMDADIPYLHEDGMVELPVSWVLDDAPYFWFDENSWNKKIHSAADVKTIWQEEFIAAYDAGGYINLTMHPQIIGRPARIAMLDEYISWIRDFDDVWITTCRELASSVAASPP